MGMALKYDLHAGFPQAANCREPRRKRGTAEVWVANELRLACAVRAADKPVVR
jgi:hypothetical protein